MSFILYDIESSIPRKVHPQTSISTPFLNRYTTDALARNKDYEVSPKLDLGAGKLSYSKDLDISRSFKSKVSLVPQIIIDSPPPNPIDVSRRPFLATSNGQHQGRPVLSRPPWLGAVRDSPLSGPVVLPWNNEIRGICTAGLSTPLSHAFARDIPNSVPERSSSHAIQPSSYSASRILPTDGQAPRRSAPLIRPTSPAPLLGLSLEDIYIPDATFPARHRFYDEDRVDVTARALLSEWQFPRWIRIANGSPDITDADSVLSQNEGADNDYVARDMSFWKAHVSTNLDADLVSFGLPIVKDVGYENMTYEQMPEFSAADIEYPGSPMTDDSFETDSSGESNSRFLAHDECELEPRSVFEDHSDDDHWGTAPLSPSIFSSSLPPSPLQTLFGKRSSPSLIQEREQAKDRPHWTHAPLLSGAECSDTSVPPSGFLSFIRKLWNDTKVAFGMIGSKLRFMARSSSK